MSHFFSYFSKFNRNWIKIFNYWLFVLQAYMNNQMSETTSGTKTDDRTQFYASVNLCATVFKHTLLRGNILRTESIFCEQYGRENERFLRLQKLLSLWRGLDLPFAHLLPSTGNLVPSPSAKTSRKFRSPFDDAKVSDMQDTGERRGLLARALARDMGGRVRICTRAQEYKNKKTGWLLTVC